MNSGTIKYPNSMRLISKKNISCNIEIIRQIQLLMNKCNTVLLRFTNICNSNQITVQFNSPGIRNMNSSKNFHHGTLASSIFTYQRQNLTLGQSEINVMQCSNTRKLLSNCRGLKQWWVFWH